MTFKTGFVCAAALTLLAGSSAAATLNLGLASVSVGNSSGGGLSVGANVGHSGSVANAGVSVGGGQSSGLAHADASALGGSVNAHVGALTGGAGQVDLQHLATGNVTVSKPGTLAQSLTNITDAGGQLGSGGALAGVAGGALSGVTGGSGTGLGGIAGGLGPIGSPIDLSSAVTNITTPVTAATGGGTLSGLSGGL
ncbi:hypothetical protein [Solirhodobacter olei]|uniref:hypothetical protein n=1 Tax=Solirhodobacter olei TaxID=2493082 RepID=UPI000FD89638|nr:hypothetical protein [Solirhodobacter olei]